MALPTSTRLTPTYLATHQLMSHKAPTSLFTYPSPRRPCRPSPPFPAPLSPAYVCRGAPLAALSELVSTLVPLVARVAVDVLCPESTVQVVVRSCPKGTHTLDQPEVLAGSPHAHSHIARIERVVAEEHWPIGLVIADVAERTRNGRELCGVVRGALGSALWSASPSPPVTTVNPQPAVVS